VPLLHQLASAFDSQPLHWQQILGLLTIAAIGVIAVVLNRTEKTTRAALPLTTLAVALALCASLSLMKTGKHRAANPLGDPAAVFYPESKPPAPIHRFKLA
jgi:CHASE2 domain-containing sensor protein